MKMAGWKPIRWYPGDQPNIQLPYSSEIKWLRQQQFPTRDFRPENMLVLISHFANSLRIMPSRIPYLTAWANGVARNGYCSG